MIKKIFITLMLIAISQTAFPQEEKYDVNFKNISMKEFITFVASFTDTNIVYQEQDLRGTVSITSQRPMNENDLMEIFNAVLANNNLNAIKENGYIRVVPDSGMMKYEDKFKTSGVDRDSFVTTTIILKNYNAIALSNSLSRVRSQYGSVEPLRGINGILIRDFGSRIEKMKSMALYMDKYASDFQLYSITLENVVASKMEQQIARLFGELMKNSLIGHMPMMVSDDAANVIVFITDKNGYQKIEYLVSQVDVKNTTSNTMPRVFYLKYAKAEDVEKVLNKLFVNASAQPPQGARPVAVKSNVSFDKSTNSIIALGDQEFYVNLENMISRLDIPRKQVYVEALILETSLDRTDKFGVEWFGGAKDGKTFGFGGLAKDGGGSSVTGILNPGAGSLPMSALPGGFSAGLIGNLITFNGISFPSIGTFLSALRQNSGVNIVSNPQILTLDNEEAEVFIGENRPYVTSEKFDSNNNPIQTFDYRNVGIRLKVTPHITGDDTIQLDIDQEVNKISPATFSNSAPVTLTRTTKTKVQLYDQSIMLISGLMKDDSSSSESGIPLLSSIPVLGNLFKTSSNSSEKTNLMVFITTHIIHTQDNMNDIIERRSVGTTSFNDKSGSFGADITNKQSFIPLQNEVGGMMQDDLILPYEVNPIK